MDTDFEDFREAMKSFFSRCYGLWSLLLGAGLIMLAVIPWDYQATVFLVQHRWKPFAEVMRRSLFEGGKLGGSDPAIFFILAMACIYLWSESPRAAWQWKAWRPVWGYMTVTSLVAGIGFIHTFKWVIGRARPHSVLKQGFPYSHWYEFGPHSVVDGVLYSSFPSGHTAAAMLLLTGCYALLGDRWLRRKWRMGGWGLAGLTFLYTSMMLIARTMARAHWLSDCLGSVVIVWILIHLAYFYLLRIPEQMAYFRRYGTYPLLPRYWELRLGAWGCGMILGLVGVLIAFRAVEIQNPPWWGLLVLPCVPLAVFCHHRAMRLYERFLSAYQLS